MTIRLKRLFAFIMILALGLGYADIYLPVDGLSFERLHIFLFNLCSGGTILLYYTQRQPVVSGHVKLFFLLSLVYAVSAFFTWYPLTLAVSAGLCLLVEKVRIDKFSIVPWQFFSPGISVAEKFHQAALLCLSIGIVMASVVIVNNEYAHWVHVEKLTLDTFFLGYSFPLSLMTLSLVFGMLRQIEGPRSKSIMELCFWVITLGVIVFFIFILVEQFLPQIFVTAALFTAVVMVLMLYYTFAARIQQKKILTSGIGFLIVTAVTGIAYICLQMQDGYDPLKTRWLLHIHVFASLYGWNLSGLSVICRFDDFPIRLHSTTVIWIHWLTALVLAPLGIFQGGFAMLAIFGYAFITFTLFFSKNETRQAV